jgi:hypothetical protein
MDILNFIYWVTSRRIVKTVDPAKSLLPIGLRDERRGDKYLTVAVTVEDFITQVGTGTQGPQGPQGPQGIQGIQGVTGATGAALTVLGSYPDLTAFLAGAGGSPGTAGTAWIIESDGSLYVWDTNLTAWNDVGDLQGPQGIQGVQGPQGIQGIQGVQGIQGPTGGSYGLYAQTANSTTVTGTAVESSLIGPGVGTLSVPANAFSVGDSFRAHLAGVLNTANNQTIRIRLTTSTGAILVDSGVQDINGIINNGIWALAVDFTIRQLGAATVASIVSLGEFGYSKTVNGTAEGFRFNVVNSTTFDTTISNTMNITVQFGSANAGNSIYSDIFVLNKIY